MEKKYPLYGLDVSEETTPLEAGLSWAVDLDGDRDFIGRDALRVQREQGPARLLAGISFPDLAYVPEIGDPVMASDGTQVGTITSSDTGHFLDQALAMAYLPPAVVAAGATVTVASSDGTSGSGTVTDRPFYDPEGSRLRA